MTFEKTPLVFSMWLAVNKTNKRQYVQRESLKDSAEARVPLGDTATSLDWSRGRHQTERKLRGLAAVAARN